MSERTAGDPIYTASNSAANPSKFFEIPFRGTVADPPAFPARPGRAPAAAARARRPRASGSPTTGNTRPLRRFEQWLADREARKPAPEAAP
jgi:hypothetical protein